MNDFHSKKIMQNKKKILRLVLVINHSTSPYNSFSLPENNHYDLTILTFFDPEIDIRDNLNVISSGGSIKNYYKLLYDLLNEDSYDIIHIHNFYSGFVLFQINIFLKKSILTKTIFTVHTSYSNLNLKHKFISIFSFLSFNKIVFCSQSSLQSFPKFFSKTFDKKKIW